MVAATINRMRLSLRWPVRIATMVIVLALVALVARNVLASDTSSRRVSATHQSVPQNAAMEASLGIRFERVAVVGDGGLVTVSYVVLDAQKATEFQSDITHPPVLTNEARGGSTKRVSLMRQGHNLRDGQTYYLVYQDTKGAIRSGDTVSITKDDLRLAHVRVL
jgi:hypothetical protein